MQLEQNGVGMTGDVGQLAPRFHFLGNPHWLYSYSNFIYLLSASLTNADREIKTIFNKTVILYIEQKRKSYENVVKILILVTINCCVKYHISGMKKGILLNHKLNDLYI